MSLEELRHDVEHLSVEILNLLNRRAEKVLEIAQEKRRLGVPIRDPYRESQLLERIVGANQGPFDAAAVRTLFRAVLDACTSLMEQSGQRALRVGSSSGPRIAVDVRGHRLGGGEPAYIAGPCAIENEEQLDEAARCLAALGIRFFRAGAYKPRTSPYAFQGLGEEGLRLLAKVAKRYDLVTITEATCPENAPIVAAYADIIQVGARNMYNYDLLRAVGQTGKPVLLKRSFSATLEEWLNAAEYVALAGSERIILCERGIRSFARETRHTLDLSIVPLALAASRLPVVVDVSHAAGRRDLLLPLARAAFAAGAAAVMVEVHPDPDVALSDAEQQLTVEDFQALEEAVREGLQCTATALEREGQERSRRTKLAIGEEWPSLRSSLTRPSTIRS